MTIDPGGDPIATSPTELNVSRRLRALWARRDHHDAKAVVLCLHAIAHVLAEHAPAIAAVVLDWSDQPDCDFLVTVEFRTSDGHEAEEGQDYPVDLSDRLWPYVTSLSGANQSTWQPYLSPVPDHPPRPVPRWQIKPAHLPELLPPDEDTGPSDADPITHHDAQLLHYPADGMPSDMYVLDVFGVRILIRRRDDGTYLHADTTDALTGAVQKPLIVEVNNAGEASYE